MSAGILNFTDDYAIEAGSDFQVQFQYYDSANNPIDVTDATIVAEGRTSADAPEKAWEATITKTDPEHGTFLMTIPATTTKTLSGSGVWALKLSLYGKTGRLVWGQYEVSPEIVR